MDAGIPSVRSSSPRIGYNYREVDIFLFQETPDLAPIEASMAELDSLIQLRPGDRAKQSNR